MNTPRCHSPLLCLILLGPAFHWGASTAQDKPRPPCETPWFFDHSLMQSECWSDFGSYKMVAAGPEDRAFVEEMYAQTPVPGSKVGGLQVIFHPLFNQVFEREVALLNGREGNPKFAPKWRQEDDFTLRSWVAARFRNLAYTYAQAPHVQLVPVWHGTSPDALDSIIQTGFASLQETDRGYFGKGVYGSTSAEYAYRVYGKTLLLAWTAVHSIYPVVDGDIPKLSGGANYGNYDAHFAPVVPQSIARHRAGTEVVYLPLKEGDVPVYDELVLFNPRQMIARYVVELQALLLSVPSARLIAGEDPHAGVYGEEMAPLAMGEGSGAVTSIGPAAVATIGGLQQRIEQLFVEKIKEADPLYEPLESLLLQLIDRSESELLDASQQKLWRLLGLAQRRAIIPDELKRRILDELPNFSCAPTPLVLAQRAPISMDRLLAHIWEGVELAHEEKVARTALLLEASRLPLFFALQSEHIVGYSAVVLGEQEARWTVAMYACLDFQEVGRCDIDCEEKRAYLLLVHRGEWLLKRAEQETEERTARILLCAKCLSEGHQVWQQTSGMRMREELAITVDQCSLMLGESAERTWLTQQAMAGLWLLFGHCDASAAWSRRVDLRERLAEQGAEVLHLQTKLSNTEQQVMAANQARVAAERQLTDARNNHQQEVETLKKQLTDSDAALVAAQARIAELESRLPALAFGPADWQKYYGLAVADAPLLPADIHQLLDGNCPIWPGRKVRETHLLTLIPKGLTLNRLAELIQRPQGGGQATQYQYYDNSYVKPELGDQPVQASYWVLMTRHILPDSRDKTYDNQKALVASQAQRTNVPYTLPRGLEAATAILTHFVRTGERLYGDDKQDVRAWNDNKESDWWTYTRCEEKVCNNQYPVAVGGFALAGLSVFSDYCVSNSRGVAGCVRVSGGVFGSSFGALGVGGV